MNKERLNKLADVIETLELDVRCYSKERNKFCMDFLYYDCGTPSCIAGWAAAQALATSRLPDELNVERTAAEWLDLPYRWAMKHLFYPSDYVGFHFADVQPRDAAAVLRYVAEIGEVENVDDAILGKLWRGSDD